jgi:uncharacterized membrane protein YhdT
MQPTQYPGPTEPAPYTPPAEPVQYGRPVAPVQRTVTTETVSPSIRASQVVYVVFGVIEALIAFRVVLKLLAANPDAGFSSLIYTITWPFVALFQGVFPTPASHGSVFEFSSVLAILVYVLLGWAIVRLIQVAGNRQTTTTSP